MGIPGFVVLQDGTSQYVEDQQTFLVQNPSARPFVLQPIPEYTHRKTPSGKQGSRQQKPNAGQLAAQREDEMWERMEREAQSMLYCGCICGMTAVTCDGCAGRGRVRARQRSCERCEGKGFTFEKCPTCEVEREEVREESAEEEAMAMFHEMAFSDNL